MHINGKFTLTIHIWKNTLCNWNLKTVGHSFHKTEVFSESRSDMVRYACIPTALLGILGGKMLPPFVMSVIPNFSLGWCEHKKAHFDENSFYKTPSTHQSCPFHAISAFWGTECFCLYKQKIIKKNPSQAKQILWEKITYLFWAHLD